jgi:hypothetical protein
LCIKRDIFGMIAARAFVGALDGQVPDLRVFCSVKTRPAEQDHPLPRLLKALERDFPIDTLLPATTTDRAALHPALRPEGWEALGDLAREGGAARLLAWQPDMVVSIRFSLIFPHRVIDAVPAGIVNVHPGPLPSYRGLYAPFWQVLNGETRLAATLHAIDPGIDTGAIIAEHHVTRRGDRSLMWHIAELYRGGAVLAAAAVRRAAAGRPAGGTPQPPGGTYWRIPSVAEADAFLRGPMPVVTAADYVQLLQEAMVPGVVAPAALAAAS